MHKLVQIACDLLDVDQAEVLSSAVYDDRVVFVVRQGYKYVVPRSELEVPEDEPQEIVATTEAMAYAKAHGVDLATVIGTGRGGRILVRDVREAM